MSPTRQIPRSSRMSSSICGESIRASSRCQCSSLPFRMTSATDGFICRQGWMWMWMSVMPGSTSLIGR